MVFFFYAGGNGAQGALVSVAVSANGHDFLGVGADFLYQPAVVVASLTPAQGGVEGGAQVWPAHPYAEAEVAAGYERLLCAADASSAADCPDAGCALLWLVHCGPAGIGTSAANSCGVSARIDSGTAGC